MCDKMNVQLTINESNQIKKYFDDGQDMIFQAAQDILNHCDNFDDPDLFECISNLKRNVEKIIFLQHQLETNIQAYTVSSRQIQNLLDSSNDDQSEHDQLDQVDEDNEINNTQNLSQLKSIKKDFENALKDLTNNKHNVTQNSYHKKFNNLVNHYKAKSKIQDDNTNEESNEEGSEEEGDINLLASNVFTIPVDPFTNQQVKDPVRNKKCGHIYDREGIKAYISTSRRPRCPTIGCVNSTLTLADIEEDRKTKIMIEKFHLERQTK